MKILMTGIIPQAAIIVGLAAGCNRLPDSYTAMVKVSPPGGADFGGRSEVGISFKRGALRVDLDPGTALNGFALAWRTEPQIHVTLPGREVSYRWDTADVAERYGIPQLDEALVLPFTESPWLKGAKPLGSGLPVDGQPCTLYAKLTEKALYRIWVHDKWAIPMRFEMATPEGQRISAYEFRKVKAFANLRDELFLAPDATASASGSR